MSRGNIGVDGGSRGDYITLVNVLDIFSGIGGISLGLNRAGMRIVAFCEREPFCRAVLAEHWPDVPCFDDIRTLDVDALRPLGVDLVAGGFPCQPVSVAGKRRGHEDERWLWPEMLRLVREVRPRWVLAENVAGLRTLGADGVLEDLESAGYSCWPLVVGADDVGAPHRRKRVWIVAYGPSGGFGMQCAEPGASWDEPDGCGLRRTSGALAYTGSEGYEGRGAERQLSESRGSLQVDWRRADRWPAGPGQRQHEWEPPRTVARTESGLGELPDGLPARLAPRLRREALKSLGNSVVPQITEAIGRAILKIEEKAPGRSGA